MRCGPGPVADHVAPAADVQIRRATDADLAAIEQVEALAGRTATASMLLPVLDDADRVLLVAEARDARGGAPQIVGWGKTHHYATPDGPAPAGHYLGGVTVAPAWRRRGVASRLVAARLAWIRGLPGAQDACYVVNARNAASLALHEPFGFVEVARGPRFHGVEFDGGEGVLLRVAGR